MELRQNAEFYIGTSTETKPVADLSGRLFYERDTGNVYQYTRSAGWSVYSKSIDGKPRVSSMPYLLI